MKTMTDMNARQRSRQVPRQGTAAWLPCGWRGRMLALAVLQLALGACLFAPMYTPRQQQGLDRAAELEQRAHKEQARGDHAAAAETLTEAVAIYTREFDRAHPRRSAALLSLGKLYVDELHDIPKASAVLDQVVLPSSTQALLTHAAAKGMGDSHLYMERASLASKVGRIEASDADVQKAYAAARAVDALDPYGTTMIRLRARHADILIQRGELEAAAALLSSGRTDVFSLLTSGRLRYRDGDLSGALDDWELSAEGTEHDLRLALTGKHRDLASSGYMAKMAAMQQGLLLSAALAHPDNERARSLAYWSTSRIQGRAFDTQAYERGEWFGEREEKLADELAELRAQLADKYLRSLSQTGEGKLDPSLAERIRALEVRMRAPANFDPGETTSAAQMRQQMPLFLAGAEREQFPRGSAGRYGQKSVEGFASGIAWVDYVVFTPLDLQDLSPYFPRAADTPTLAAFVLRAGQTVPTLVVLGDVAEIEALAAPLRRGLSDRTSDLADVRARAGRLFDRVWRPLEPALGEDLTHAVVVADGPLGLVPMAALYDPERSAWLSESLHVSYADSTREQVVGVPVQARSGQAVVLADPSGPRGGYTYDPLKREGFSRLPGAAREARALQPVLGSVTLTGDRVREATVRGVTRPRILHIASHAVFLPPAPATGLAVDGTRGGALVATAQVTSAGAAAGGQADLGNANAAPTAPQPLSDEDWLRVALVLGPPAEGECCDAFLTGYELVAMDLHGTELVTLSACDTNVGRASDAHGVSSLRRALSMAGARSVVASLWQVSDASTVELMVAFYRALAEGATRVSALNRAMDAVRTSKPHPYYWAAFGLAGHVGPLASR